MRGGRRNEQSSCLTALLGFWLAAAMSAHLSGTEIGLLHLASDLLQRLADADSVNS